MSMKNSKYTTLLMVVYTLVTVSSVAAELQRFDHQPTKGDGSLSILVVGDWGRRGLYNQSNVAFQMGKVGEKYDADFIISTGDNFYEDGLLDEEDDLFVESFTQVYTAPSLQKQWYSVLGNHDYRGNALAQLSPVLTQKDRKWLCLRSFIVNSGLIKKGSLLFNFWKEQKGFSVWASKFDDNKKVIVSVRDQ
uniref:Purple acid phosphatase 8-like n=1 Tax=Tanacetum cinerariifolium TaxID=118510 RepID=A0A699HYI2_TANCI|nr:purple acid phosphatase 8-like [Tanacetum cinerariifolium]